MKKGLGRGLDALMSMDSDNENDSFITVKITDIDPNIDQPRKLFNDEGITELSDSIKNHGIVQPIIVVQEGKRYKIVAGERRWRAARIAGLDEVPVVVKNFDEKEQLEISLIENIQRQDLNPIEEAEAYKNFMEKFNLTQDELSKKIGKSRAYVANLVRLNNLDDKVKSLLNNTDITYGHAKVLVSLDKDEQFDIAMRVVEKEMSVRQLEDYLKNYKNEKVNAEVKTDTNKNHIHKEIEEFLQNKFGTKVSISNNKKKGVIEIEYYSDDDLERIINCINK